MFEIPVIITLSYLIFNTISSLKLEEDYLVLDDLPLFEKRLVYSPANPYHQPLEDVVYAETANDTKVYIRSAELSNFTRPQWLEEAIKDIAYYLRAHKFNEYDRRYENESSRAARTYYMNFPRPPLRSLHWEVHAFCEPSFLKCVEYLWKIVNQVERRRTDDTAVVIMEQKWNRFKDAQQINMTDEECKKAREKEETFTNPFQGPIERFQWRTTASYYMCWYTMHEVSDLRHLKENCANHANCLDPEYYGNNGDYRANDNVPFACAMYSFCPDACCLRKHASNSNQCYDAKHNPCFQATLEDSCKFSRNENRDFRSLILNKFNVSCHCLRKGFVYNSMFGLCVDVDECATKSHECRNATGEACLNTKGSYKCVCKFGYRMSKRDRCVKDIALTKIKMKQQQKTEETDVKKEKSVLRRYFKMYYAKFKSWKNSATSILNLVGVKFIVITYINNMFE